MDRLLKLYREYAGCEPESVTPFAASGSHRRYYRMAAGDRSVVGVLGTDRDENDAFVTLARHFLSKGLPVPEVYAVSPDGMAYIQQDLGDVSLYSMKTEENLLKTISLLPDLQFKGAEGLDFSVCYPDSCFNARMVDFDLNYFKYCFLKTSGVEFNEVRLQDEFDRLKEDLLSEAGDTFMYRDFQARNVMLKEGSPYFIDFQGGRRGPVYYDLASFVWQVSARYPDDLKGRLVDAYLASAGKYMTIDRAKFDSKLRLFIIFRLLQVLGAYGFRGKIERKPYFLASIDPALRSLRSFLPVEGYPYLSEVLGKMTDGLDAEKPGNPSLAVDVYSFSFRKGIPEDTSGNGGGYVFDCRSIHNPGRYEPYKNLTGRDPEVIRFLEDDGEVFQFLDHAYAVVDAHVEKFLKRGFNHLQVSFGCTGGQHRSVYCAEHMAAHLRSKYNITVNLRHLEH